MKRGQSGGRTPWQLWREMFESVGLSLWKSITMSMLIGAIVGGYLVRAGDGLQGPYGLDPFAWLALVGVALSLLVYVLHKR